MQNTPMLPVNIMFKEADDKSAKLQTGTMTMDELYSTNSMVWVTNACGDGRYISRRDFHIYDPEPYKKRRAIVCDIDGVLNYIPSKNHRERIILDNAGNSAQWTELNLTSLAKKNITNFKMLASFSQQGFELLFLTARGDSQRVVTEEFIREGLNDACCYAKFTTFMRGFSCNDIAAPEMKAMMMQACILPYYDVEYFIEDCPRNIQMMRVTCPDVPCMHIIS